MASIFSLFIREIVLSRFARLFLLLQLLTFWLRSVSGRDFGEWSWSGMSSVCELMLSLFWMDFGSGRMFGGDYFWSGLNQGFSEIILCGGDGGGVNDMCLVSHARCCQNGCILLRYGVVGILGSQSLSLFLGFRDVVLFSRIHCIYCRLVCQ